MSPAATDSAVDERFLTRFKAALDAVRRDGRIGLAVSGGADSMAMLVLANRMAGDIEIEVATVDHGLRPESRSECEFVAAACEKRSVPCTILTPKVAPGNLQQEARKARYRALGDWARARGLSCIATAHHADDQAETVMMRFNRGSGLAGLAGIRERTRIDGCATEVIRPLLGFRREELRAVLDQAGQGFVSDPSNEDDSYDRVRMRQSLASADWIDPAAIARSARHLAEAETSLQSMADTAYERQATVAHDRVTIPYTEWQDTNARLVRRAIAEFGGLPQRSEVADLLLRLDRPDARGNLAGVLVERSVGLMICTPEPPRQHT